jgi:peptidoglycan/xylan/chitin deacetylase (PgdA/CDA1 family)
MLGDGHEIGNHMDSHPHLTSYAENGRHATRAGLTREAVITELQRAEASFGAVTGRAMVPYWRAPYGEHNAEIRAWAAEAGYRHVGWTRGAGTAEDLDTRDWVADRSSRLYRTREEVASRLLGFGQKTSEGLNGGIVLMHLGSLRMADRPHEELPHVLQALQTQGYRLVTVSTLLEHAAPQYAGLPPQPRPVAE